MLSTKQFAEPFDLNIVATDLDGYDLPAVFIGEGDIESRCRSWANGCDIAEIPIDRRLSISDLAKEFGGSWAGGFDDLVEELLINATSALRIRQCFADSGLPEAEQWRALERARELIREQYTSFEQAYRDMHASKN
jgi:hypothetical protein